MNVDEWFEKNKFNAEDFDPKELASIKRKHGKKIFWLPNKRRFEAWEMGSDKALRRHWECGE